MPMILGAVLMMCPAAPDFLQSLAASYSASTGYLNKSSKHVKEVVSELSLLCEESDLV
jgi:hypothetical protein